MAAAFIGTNRASPPAPEQPGLDAKIGQMLMVGFSGLEVDAGHPIVEDITGRNLGGVILFDYDVITRSPVRNVESPSQVKALVDALQAVAPTPLLVAIDQEGGMIRRLKEEHGFPPTVSARFLGTRNDLDLTRQHATSMAQTLAQLGINLNLAPVVDLDTNPDNPAIGKLERSFSADPAVVTAHALAFIEAHHRQNVLCSLKHFPGHGSSTADSHLGLVDVTTTWSRDELKPYASLIQAGMADAVMTAHVYHTELDPEYPATLSKPIITGMLRGELGYDGVVISDDMQMSAITQHYGFETAMRATIEAGVDIIVIGNNLVRNSTEHMAVRTVELVKRLVQSGQISEARIDESYQRIMRLKHKLKTLAPQRNLHREKCREAPTD